MNPNNPADSELSSAAFTLAGRLARLAGQRIRELRETNAFEVSLKRPRDLVTTADLEADRIITEGIRSAFPAHRILSEESSPNINPRELHSGAWWIIDPIDGTANYAAGQPQVGVSVAFALNGTVEAGVIFAPFQNDLYESKRGTGSFLNGKRLQCRDTRDLKRSLVATGFPYDRSDIPGLLSRVHRVLDHCQDLRRLGAASLDVSWIAAARMEAFYETLHPWDIAAAGLIAREAAVRTGNLREISANEQYPADLRGIEFFAAVPGIYEPLRELLAPPRID